MSFLGQLFSGTQVVASLAQASDCLRSVEQELRDEMMRTGTHTKFMAFPHLDLSPREYWERNFFSILFVSIFDAMGIPAQRVREYAAVLHCIRGIVTATDNIIDDESKGAVRFELSGGRVLPNVLSMLLQQAVLVKHLRKVAIDDEACDETYGALFDCLYAIGEEESGEEDGVEQVLPPLALLDEIHRYRGASLLLLAFVAPEINEPEKRARIAEAKAGVARIGMALQILDDLADFDEDLRRRNHNVLRSWLVHPPANGERRSDEALLALSSEARKSPERVFPRAAAEVMVLAVEMALEGFEHLANAGHPIRRDVAREMMAAMFRLRGLSRLWEVYEGQGGEVDKTRLSPLLSVLSH